MADFISEDAFQECMACIDSLRQRLAGPSVPRPELMDLFRGLLLRMEDMYADYFFEDHREGMQSGQVKA